MSCRPLIAAACIVAGLAPSAAAAQDGLTLDVSGGVTAGRNPFLQPGNGTGAAGVYLQLDPRWRLDDASSTVAIGGSLRYEQYTRRYDGDLSGRLGLDVTRRLSPATRLNASASARISRSNALDFVSTDGGIAPTDPPIALPDVTFAGSRSRATLLQASVGVEHDINPREAISLDVGASSALFSRADQADYRYASADGSYRRLLSGQTWGVASIRVAASDYLGQKSSDGLVVSPSLGVITEIGPRLTLQVGGGVSFSRIRLDTGRHASRTIPAFNGKLCERGESGSTCLSAARENQPTALSGLTTVTSISATVARRLNARDEFGANAGFTITERNRAQGVFAPGADLFTVTATYTRNFDRRFAAFISPSYSRIYDTLTSRRANPGIRFGLRYRFGVLG